MASKSNTIDARRHVNIVPVRLLRPEANLRKKNKDRMFAKSFCDDIKNICPLFGRDIVNYISVDDKAKVAIGLTAAKCQAPILMHVQYKVCTIYLQI